MRHYREAIEAMKKLVNEKGFSLVEVIVAMAILMIIITAFTALFTGSFSGIFTAGRKSEALYRAQSDMDAVINSAGTADYDEDIISVTEKAVTIPFTGADSINYGESDGLLVVVEYPYEDRTGEIIYYLPVK